MVNPMDYHLVYVCRTIGYSTISIYFRNNKDRHDNIYYISKSVSIYRSTVIVGIKHQISVYTI